MKRLLLIISCCFIAGLSLGQTHKIDNLKGILQRSKNDQMTLRTLLNLCDEFETLPKDTLWDYAIRAKKLSAKLKDTQSMSLAIVAQANAYLKWGNADSAKALVEPELAKYKVENPATRAIYFKLAQLKIDCIGSDGEYKDAMTDVFDIIRKAEKYNDPIVLAESMNTLCAWNYDMDFLAKGRAWGYKGLALTSDTPPFYPVLTVLYLNLAQSYWWTTNLDSATYCIGKAIGLSSKLENLYLLSTALQIKASIYTKKQKYADAEKTIMESIRVIEKVNGKAPQQDKLIVLASLYEKSGQIDKAISVMNDGLVQDSLYKTTSIHSKRGTNAGDLQRIFYFQELAKCYRQKGDAKDYEAALEKIILEKGNFYKANSAQAIAELETKYQVQKKEATIARQKLSLVRENYLFFGSLLLALLGAVIAWLVFKGIRRRQKIKLQQLQEEEKRLSAKAVAEAEETERRRIAADLHDNLGAQLSFIKRNVNFIMDQPAGFSAADERKYLSSVNDIAQNAMIDLRKTIWVLNKDEVDIQEFADKLKAYMRQQLMGRDDIQWSFKETVFDNWKLQPGEVMHIFRIVQELISNVIKHSGASELSVNFESNLPDCYKLTLLDNGKGFDTCNKYDGHYGLENIEHRAREISAALLVTSNSTGTGIVLQKVKK